jgi:two-component system sensor histidine kinase PilS (NtrC family)
MNQVLDFSGYPLSQKLTRRVVNYLNGFRLFISVALTVAWYNGLLVQGTTITNATLSATVLVVYFMFSVYFIFAARKAQERNQSQRIYDVALQSLLMDVFLIAVMLNVFDGLAVLLVFVGAAAGMIMPLRVALLVCSVAALAVLTQPFLSPSWRDLDSGLIVAAGLFGVTLFTMTIITHLLACWARDFRLIAERQMATLTRLEQVNELIIRRLRSGVLAVDAEGQIQMMNESAWFLLGSPPASKRNLGEVSPELFAALKEWRDNPRLESDTLSLNASQADVVPKFVAVPDGREVSVVVFLEDNDVVSQRALEISSLSLAKLSSSIAHEVRNPLAAVSHAAQLLEEDANLDSDQARLLTIVRNNVKRMNGIIENILQLSRREKSQHELINITAWLGELVAEFEAAQPKHSFKLRVNPADADTLVLFDRSQLHQVLWKLMDNAAEHLGEDNAEPQLTLRFRADDESGFCVLTVEDNGQGISEKQMSEIFEPFYTTRKEGSGLGLYIARQLCEANQAELTVDSEPGVRTRFHIRMALAAASTARNANIDAFRELS